MKDVLSLLLVSPLAAEDKIPSPGEQAFKVICSACHLLAIEVVGPSLVEIAKTYPRKKRGEFVAWAKAPGKKNPRLIQMPSMAHVPDGDLTLIHQHIINFTKRVKPGKRAAFFPGFQEPKRDLPYVVRANMPESSPASVGIVLENGLGVSWDTEACRFRHTCHYHKEYGSPKVDLQTVKADQATLSGDGKILTIKLPEITARRLYTIELEGAVDAKGEPLMGGIMGGIFRYNVVRKR